MVIATVVTAAAMVTAVIISTAMVIPAPVIPAPVIISTAVTSIVWISESEGDHWRIYDDRRWIVCRLVRISGRTNRRSINRCWD
jgi:hypothetical protein